MIARLNGCLTEYIEFKDFFHVSGDRFSCNLRINSPPFQAIKTFDFEISFAQVLIAKLKEFYRTPHRFEPFKLAVSLWEQEYISFSGDDLGHISVEGILVKHGNSIQMLDFSFATDQTMIKNFIIDFEKLLNDANHKE